MKLLILPNLTDLQDEVKNTFVRYDGDIRIECYSCKMTQKEKRHYKNLCHTFGQDANFPLSNPQCDNYRQRLSSIPIEIERITDEAVIDAKTYTFLTSAFSLCYREVYDFSKCESSEFSLERSSEEVVEVTDKIMEKFVELYHQIRHKMWSEIDKVISLRDCKIYSYKSANKPDDPHAVNNHNGINFLFFNHNLRRLLLFTIKFYDFTSNKEAEDDTEFLL